MSTWPIDARALDSRALDARVLQARAAISELMSAADEFAERAEAQELRRDGARSGTPSHHQYAHSATLWRSAERAIRTRILELELLSEACERPAPPTLVVVPAQRARPSV